MNVFFIMAYEDIFSEMHVFFRVLQNDMLDIIFYCLQICGTNGFVEWQRQEIDSFCEWFKQKCTIFGL